MIEFRAVSRANMFRLLKTEVSTKSKYQEIVIADVQGFGRAVFLDGLPQSSAKDEFIYHEALIHPALVANKSPKKVYIAGGGEGAVLREILKHNTIEKVVMVDIDEEFINLSREYLYDWHQGTYDHEKVELVHGDARTYLEETEERFDVIIMDLTDPLEDGVSTSLFTTEFFSLAKSRLAEGGVLCMQAETVDITDIAPHVSIVKTLQQCFKNVLPYQTYIPYYGLAWGFVVASDHDIRPRFDAETLTQTLKERDCNDLKFYDSESHQHMFSLPKYLRDAIADPNVGKIVSDEQPLIVEPLAEGEKGNS